MQLYTILNAILYTAMWWSIALSPNTLRNSVAGYWLIAIAIVHFSSKKRWKDIAVIFAAGWLGIVAETYFYQIGIISFPGHTANSTLIPGWLIALWFAFASTLFYPLKPILKRPLIAMVCGALGGPLTYYAAIKFNALTWPNMALGVGVYCVFWALFMGAWSLYETVYRREIISLANLDSEDE